MTSSKPSPSLFFQWSQFLVHYYLLDQDGSRWTIFWGIHLQVQAHLRPRIGATSAFGTWGSSPSDRQSFTFGTGVLHPREQGQRLHLRLRDQGQRLTFAREQGHLRLGCVCPSGQVASPSGWGSFAFGSKGQHRLREQGQLPFRMVVRIAFRIRVASPSGARVRGISLVHLLVVYFQFVLHHLVVFYHSLLYCIPSNRNIICKYSIYLHL